MCIHIQGVDERYCALCRQALEQAPLPEDPLRSFNDGTPVFILRIAGPGTAKVMTERGLSEVRESDLQSEAESWRARDMRERLSAAAAMRGFLFVPDQPLTWREQLDEVGPSRCYHCRIELSLERRSLGCSACRYYVCRCGRCLCGYTGRNWKGELFSQFPPLPIARTDRLEFLRAFCFLNPS
jgi:hypothetical protein